jgi:hypothetical protein
MPLISDVLFLCFLMLFDVFCSTASPLSACGFRFYVTVSAVQQSRPEDHTHNHKHGKTVWFKTQRTCTSCHALLRNPVHATIFSENDCYLVATSPT